MSSSRSTLLVAVSSCVATLVFVSTAHLSCGEVEGPSSACAADCPDPIDVGPLQDRITALEANRTSLEASVASLEASLASVRASLAPVSFFGFLGGAQSIATSVDTQVLIDSVLRDTNTAFDMTTHEYVVPVAGQYVITATVSYGGGATGMAVGRANNVIRVVRKLNQEIADHLAATLPANSSGTGSLLMRINGAITIHLEAEDRVSLRTFQDSGVATAKPLQTGARETVLEIARIPSVN